MERFSHKPEDVRTENVAKTCRVVLHCRTGHGRLKSMTEELGGSELLTGEGASLSQVIFSFIVFTLTSSAGPPSQIMSSMNHGGAPRLICKERHGFV